MYNKVDFAGLAAMAPEFDWKLLFAELHNGQLGRIYHARPDCLCGQPLSHHPSASQSRPRWALHGWVRSDPNRAQISWVRSRAFPTQPYKESGFPHGKDQWISAAGTSWAAMALSLEAEPGRP